MSRPLLVKYSSFCVLILFHLNFFFHLLMLSTFLLISLSFFSFSVSLVFRSCGVYFVSPYTIYTISLLFVESRRVFCNLPIPSLIIYCDILKYWTSASYYHCIDFPDQRFVNLTLTLVWFSPLLDCFLAWKVYFVNDRKMAVDDEDRHLFYPIVSPETLSCDSLGNKHLPGSSV